MSEGASSHSLPPFQTGNADEVVRASYRLLGIRPEGTEMVTHRDRLLNAQIAGRPVTHCPAALSSTDASPVELKTLLKARRDEDVNLDLWATQDRVQENPDSRFGVSDSRRDKRRRLRSVRAIRGIISKLDLNKGLVGTRTTRQRSNRSPLSALAMN